MVGTRVLPGQGNGNDLCKDDSVTGEKTERGCVPRGTSVLARIYPARGTVYRVLRLEWLATRCLGMKRVSVLTSRPWVSDASVAEARGRPAGR